MDQTTLPFLTLAMLLGRPSLRHSQGGEFFLLQKSLLIGNMLPTLAFFLIYFVLQKDVQCTTAQ